MNYLLLLASSFVPATAGILLTLPLWRMKRLHNPSILTVGLIILFGTGVACLVPAFLIDAPGLGFPCIAVSSINIFLFRHYERLLQTLRCPCCHSIALHILSVRDGHYKLYCNHCGLHSEWEA